MNPNAPPLLMTETLPASAECNLNLPSALLHRISLAPLSRVEYFGMNIYRKPRLWWAARKKVGE